MPGDDLQDLIGKFLQQMINGPDAEPVRRPRPAPRPRNPADAVRQAAPPRAPLRRPVDPAVIDAQIVEAEPVTGDDVAEHVARHLDSGRVTAGARHLGEEVARADDVLLEHQQQFFGKGPGSRLSVTQQADSTTSVAPKVADKEMTAPARQLVAMLRSPESLRAAFILGEVLNRPSW